MSATTVKRLVPKFKPLPVFNPAETPQKWQRQRQYLDAGKDITTAIRKTDADFKAHEKAQALKDSADHADEEARANSVG